MNGRAHLRKQHSAATCEMPRATCHRPRTLTDLLEVLRRDDVKDSPCGSEDAPNCEVSRWADDLFLLRDNGSLGTLNPQLQFFLNGRPLTPESTLDSAPGVGNESPLEILVDFSQSTYSRNWPAYLKRRWSLRRNTYERFVLDIMEDAYGELAETVMRLDSPLRTRQFLSVVAARIHAAPYETYSRYRRPYHPFKSCDRALDSIIDGDGGVCSEKAMAFYFIATAYGIPTEIVLGGENAVGHFPYSSLRRFLDQPQFVWKGTEYVQRYWQHFAVLCHLDEPPGDFMFYDVADSNIPLITWDAKTASRYVVTSNKTPLPVQVTLEPVQLYYHRISEHQDIALDLYFAMEHFIDFIDLMQTIDNDLGLFISHDFWVGAICHRDQREREAIIRDYFEFLRNAGRSSKSHICFTSTLAESEHPLIRAFRRTHGGAYDKIASTHHFLKKRIHEANCGETYQVEYVALPLHSVAARDQ